MKRLLLPLFVSLLFLQVYAESRFRVSILTCSPGEQVYEFFGHTALRVTDTQAGRDVVFNYGLFSFDEPNFVWRFVLGETDYLLGATDFRYFMGEYAIRGSGVTEQVLNLDSLSAERIVKDLYVNLSPENCKYRYNFLFNNCTTKARDVVFNVICADAGSGMQNRIVYPAESMGDTLSFRQIVHRFTEDSPWYRLGMDMLLGSPADEIAGRNGAQFAPIIFKEELADAVVVNAAGCEDALLKEQNELLLPVAKQCVRSNFTPFNTALLLLLFTFIVMLCEKRSKKTFLLWDVLLMGLQGVAGCLLTFMVLFSQHPAVDVNWLLLWLNPLPLFLLIAYIYSVKKGLSKNILWVEVAMVLLFFILSPFVPQYFPAPLYPCAVALLVRSLFNIYKNKICALD